jgi:hypothetical protein
MSNIKQARQLIELALARLEPLEAHIPGVQDATDLLTQAEAKMHRRKYKRAPAKHTILNHEHFEHDVRQFTREHPNAHQTEVARWLGVNPGRVSEALHGKAS